MTPEELDEIKERYSMSLKTFSLNNLARLGTDAHRDIPKLLAYIKELESQITQWIPVEERLPEESGYYLCWDIIACESAIPYVAVCCFRKERGSFDSCSDLCITHWQPLPKGPEE